METPRHTRTRAPGGPREADSGEAESRGRSRPGGRRHTKAAELPERACPPLAPRPPPALTSGRSRRAPGAHGRQPPAPARPRCHGERAGPRAADAEPRSGTRADARRAARRRPRRPAAREGRGEPGGGGEPPSGREATEEGDGPEAEVTPRPTRPSSAQSPLPSPRPLTCRHFRRAGPVAFCLISARRREPTEGGYAGRVWSGTHRFQTTPARKLRTPGPRATAGDALGDLSSWGHQASRLPDHRPPRCLLGQFTDPCSPGPRPGPARQATQANVTSAAPRAGAPKPGLTACLPPRARPQPGAQRTRDLESKGFTHTGHVTAP